MSFSTYEEVAGKSYSLEIPFTVGQKYIVFVHNLLNIDLNLANKRRRKVLVRRVWLLRSKAVTMTRRHSNVTSANHQLHLSVTSLTRKVA